MLILCSLFANALPAQSSWHRVWWGGSDSEEMVTDICPLGDNGAWVSFNHVPWGFPMGYALRYDASGNRLDTLSLLDFNFSLPYRYSFDAIHQTRDSSLYIAGTRKMRVQGVNQFGFFICKYKKDGTPVWNRHLFSQPGWQLPSQYIQYDLHELADSTLLLQAGSHLIRVRKDGTMIWGKIYPFSINRIVVTAQQHLLVAGDSTFAILTDSGSVLQAKSVDNFWLSDFQQHPDGGYLLAGNTGGYVSSMGLDTGGVVLVRLDDQFNIRWSRFLNHGLGMKNHQMLIQPDRSLVLGGYLQDNGAQTLIKNIPFVARYDSSGLLQGFHLHHRAYQNIGCILNSCRVTPGLLDLAQLADGTFMLAADFVVHVGTYSSQLIRTGYKGESGCGDSTITTRNLPYSFTLFNASLSPTPFSGDSALGISDPGIPYAWGIPQTICYNNCLVKAQATPSLNHPVQGDSLILQNTSLQATSYQWRQSAGGPVLSTATDYSLYFPQAGNYTLHLTAIRSGCSDTTSFHFQICDTLQPDLGPDQLICPGDQLWLYPGLSSSSTATIIWPGNILADSFAVRQPGHYSVAVMDVAGCQTTDSLLISKTPAWDFSVGPDQLLCPQDSLLLIPTYTGGLTGYHWQDGVIASSRMVPAWTGAGLWWAEVRDSQGCSRRDSMLISYPPSPLTLPDSLPLCSGDTLSYQAPAGFQSYQWSTGDSGSVVRIAQGGQYALTVEAASGCLFADTFAVNQISISPPQISYSQSLLDFQFQGLAGTGVKWFWSFGDGTTDTVPNPMHTYTAPGSYQVCLTVTDQNLCSASACDTVTAILTGRAPVRTLSDIKIWPNPATDYLTIEIKGHFSTTPVFRLYDQLGRRIRLADISTLTKHQYQLDLSKIPRGVWMLEVEYQGRGRNCYQIILR